MTTSNTPFPPLPSQVSIARDARELSKLQHRASAAQAQAELDTQNLAHAAELRELAAELLADLGEHDHTLELAGKLLKKADSLTAYITNSPAR